MEWNCLNHSYGHANDHGYRYCLICGHASFNANDVRSAAPAPLYPEKMLEAVKLRTAEMPDWMSGSPVNQRELPPDPVRSLLVQLRIQLPTLNKVHPRTRGGMIADMVRKIEEVLK